MNLTLQNTTANDPKSAWYDILHTSKQYVKVKKSFQNQSIIYYIRSEVADGYVHPLENLRTRELTLMSDFIVDKDTNCLEKCRFNMEELIDKFLIIED
jgi:hypothetical protein